jgi:hypothetical protein
LQSQHLPAGFIGGTTMEVHYIDIASDKPEFLPLPKLQLKRKGVQFDRARLIADVRGRGWHHDAHGRFYVVRPPTWEFEL